MSKRMLLRIVTDIVLAGDISEDDFSTIKARAISHMQEVFHNQRILEFTDGVELERLNNEAHEMIGPPGTVYIMRGIPGCGKTTKANEVKQKHLDNGETCYVVSADDFWNEERKYSPSLIRSAHTYCQKMFNKLIFNGVENIVVDNTHTRLDEYDEYVQMAELMGYKVTFLEFRPSGIESVIKWNKRCVHNVPLWKSVQMWERWEERKEVKNGG